MRSEVRYTGRPLTQSNYTRRCMNTIILLKMSTKLLETCRGFKETYYRRNCASSCSHTRIIRKCTVRKKYINFCLAASCYHEDKLQQEVTRPFCSVMWWLPPPLSVQASNYLHSLFCPLTTYYSTLRILFSILQLRIVRVPSCMHSNCPQPN